MVPLDCWVKGAFCKEIFYKLHENASSSDIHDSHIMLYFVDEIDIKHALIRSV